MKTKLGNNLPDFVCLGVQKGGTTTLHEMLKNHPKAYLPKEKETHFFSNNYDKGTTWYENIFKDCGREQLCGEITPYYLYHPLAAGRMLKIIPNAKLIILLRDPVDRAISQYFHSRRLGLEKLEIEKAFLAEKERLQDSKVTIETMGKKHISHQEHSYTARSKYEEQIPRWERHFRKENILVVKSEDFFKKPNDEWIKILDFLKLQKIDLVKEKKEANTGKGEAKEVKENFKKSLREQLNKTYTWAKKTYDINWERE